MYNINTRAATCTGLIIEKNSQEHTPNAFGMRIHSPESRKLRSFQACCWSN